MYSVYRNLHNGKLSIKSLKTGLIVGHADEVALKDVNFKVNSNGVDRIRKLKRKEVVATVLGSITHMDNFTSFRGRGMPSTFGASGLLLSRRIGFNPYKYNSFVTMKDEKRVDTCKAIFINATGTMLASAK